MKCALLKKASGAGWSPAWRKAGDINNARGSASPRAGMAVIRWNHWCLQCCKTERELSILWSQLNGSEGENEFGLGTKVTELCDFEGGLHRTGVKSPSLWQDSSILRPSPATGSCWNLQDSLGSSLVSQGSLSPITAAVTMSPALSS